MLEGLEVREKNLYDTMANKDFRIDSDFWTKEPKLNPKLQYDKIGNCLKSAQYGISIGMNEDNNGYPIYRMNEIHNMLCDFEVSKCANISKYELEIFRLNDRDILFNRTNSFEWVGRTGIYRKRDKRDFVFASYLVRFVPNQEKLLPEYLTTFLNSKYGVWDVKRRARQSINQTNVNPEEVKEVNIPLLSLGFQEKLKYNFEKSVELLATSKQLYTQAENILLQEIGLQDFAPNQEAINIKSFKESFSTSGRLDAEYYQLKYEDYVSLIRSYSNGFETLETVCNLKDNNVSLNDNEVYKYIELSNIGKSGEITGCTEELGKELPSRARRKVNKNDVIISSIEGSLQSCAVVSEQYNNALCSTGFYVINSDKLNCETLLVLFKSEPMQSLLKQNCSGTILTAINKAEFQNILIPLIKKTVQEKIADLVSASFRLKTESEQLLETAKRAVEIAIEEDEEAAIKYLNAAK